MSPSRCPHTAGGHQRGTDQGWRDSVQQNDPSVRRSDPESCQFRTQFPQILRALWFIRRKGKSSQRVPHFDWGPNHIIDGANVVIWLCMDGCINLWQGPYCWGLRHIFVAVVDQKVAYTRQSVGLLLQLRC